MSRASKYFLAFVGNSLQINPAPPNSLRDVAAAAYPHNSTWNFGIGGASWAELLAGTNEADGKPASKWVHPYLKTGVQPILVCVGGIQAVNTGIGGEAKTGAQAYADLWAYTDAAYAAVPGLIVVVTTITPASYVTGGAETERHNANTAIKNDATVHAHQFDAVIDLVPNANTDLDKFNDATYYLDESGTKVHWTPAGRDLSWSRMHSTLDGFIPSNYR